MRFMVVSFGEVESGSCGNCIQRALDVREHQYSADEIEADEGALPEQPGILARSDWGVIKAWPDGVEDEVAGVANGKDAEQANDAQPQRRRAAFAYGTARGSTLRDNLREPKCHHAEAACLHGGDRQCPRAGVPERDVLEELFAGRPACAATIVADDTEYEKHTEDEQPEAPFRKSCT